MVGYYIPFLLLPSYAVNGTGGHISEQSAAYLLTALGFSNTFGRLISGVLATRNWLDSVIINNLALLIAGAMTLVLPFCESYFLLVVFSFVFGLCVAAFSSLRSVIVVELMGLDKLTTCYSQLVIFHGISVLIGAPVAGYLLDKYNYFYPFYFAGGCMLLSGLLSMFLRKVAQVERRKSGHGGSQSSSENEMKMKSLGTPHEIVGLG
ncbi:hypothetical protein EB796_009175 [Bugula neritina]|nr:hypothetical protein EB796_009175 [Bugula neritina]